jgi:tetratricopeptide (TPR) repeat protein
LNAAIVIRERPSVVTRIDFSVLPLMAAALLMLSSASAHAQVSAGDEARAHFKLGQGYYEHGRFLEAAHEFEAAYQAESHPKLLYNIYLAYRDLNQLDKASQALRSYLDAVPDDPNADQLRARLGAMEEALRVRGNAGSKQELNVSASRSAAAEAAAPAASPQSTQAAPASSVASEEPPSLVLPIVLASTGGALLIGAGVSQALASSTRDELHELCPDSDCSRASAHDDARAKKLQSRGKTLVGLSYGLAGAGVLSVGAAAIVYFVTRPEALTETPSVSFACMPGECSASWQGRF